MNQQQQIIIGSIGSLVFIIIVYFMFFRGPRNCLTIGEHQLCSEGPVLTINREGHPKKIMLYTGGDHSSIMTQRVNNTDHWFGY